MLAKITLALAIAAILGVVSVAHAATKDKADQGGASTSRIVQPLNYQRYGNPRFSPDVPQAPSPVIPDDYEGLNRSQSLDHAAGHFPVRFDQGGPSAADRWTSSIGTFGIMSVAARIVGNAGVCTILTALDVTTELRRATRLDRTHGSSLAKAYVPGFGRAPRLSKPPLDTEEVGRNSNLLASYCDN